MKHLTLSFLLALVTCTAMAQNSEYFSEYGNKPLYVINRTGGGEAKLYLVGETEGELIFRYNPTSPQEFLVPLDTEDLLIYYPPKEELTNAVYEVNDAQYSRAIKTMRPYVYPMVQYLEVPADKFNIHPYVERFAFALVNEPGNEVEAAAFFRRLPLNKLSPEFNSYAMQLVEQLVEKGMNADALAILDKLPFTGANSILPRIMFFANKLRVEGNIEEALFLYQRVQDVKDAPEAKTATLWIAYCNVALDRLETAKLFLQEAGSIKPGDENFALHQLVQGRIQLILGQVQDAMAEVSRGVIYTDVGASWAPEIVYTSGFCYEQLGNTNAAREVYTEVILFYPETEWGIKSKERREALPPRQTQEEAPAEDTEAS